MTMKQFFEMCDWNNIWYEWKNDIEIRCIYPQQIQLVEYGLSELSLLSNTDIEITLHNVTVFTVKGGF